jgi:hypothetical protein
MATGLRRLAGTVEAWAMRSAPQSLGGRRTPLRFACVTALAAALASGLSGCVAITAAQPGGGRTQLVSDLAGRLNRSGSLTFTAVYRLPQGATATIAQTTQPSRAAYTYPGGKLVLTPDETADCRAQGGATTCTLTQPPSPGTDPGTALLDGMATHGLIPPSMVVGLLTAAALEPDAVVTTHDTTVAGENATCVHIKGVQNAAASEFDACVTTDGLLGSFSGAVSGAEVDISLERYDPTVAPSAFDLPAGARVVDRRPTR